MVQPSWCGAASAGSLHDFQKYYQIQHLGAGRPVGAERIACNKCRKKEAEFQALSPGGAISYVEVPDLQKNIPAVLQLINFIYDNIMYAELNTKSDYCSVCGYDGEIKIKGEPGHLYWECPNCGNTDQSKMTVVRRVCGYLGTNYFNQGRTQDIRDRIIHLDARPEK